MTVAFKCPACKKGYRVRDALAGKRLKCKSCGESLQVPRSQQGNSEDNFLNSLDEMVQMEAHASKLETPPPAVPMASPKSDKKSRLSQKSSKSAGGKKAVNKTRYGTPISLIIAGLMLVIAGFGWGVMAGAYAGAHKSAKQARAELEDAIEYENWRQDHIHDRYGRRPPSAAKIYFFGTAIQHLPIFGTVIAWNFSNRLWIPILFISLEVVAVLIGVKMKKLEREWDALSQKV